MTKAISFSASSGIHQGDRESQQDRVSLFRNAREPDCVLAIVSDGMGGMTGGRKASDQVMLTAEQLFKPFSSKDDNPTTLLEKIALDAHMVIGLTAMASSDQPHTTYAAFLIASSGSCYWAHVGDSRIYHFRDAQLLYRTRDHSYVQSLVDSKEITPLQAVNHPQSNILTQCLGSKVVPKVSHYTIPKLLNGDVVMACSDGVWPYFSEVELGSILNHCNPREATELIISTARSRSKKRGDNLSLAVVKYGAAL
jgi:serine/threonine protein phosphatase PrpC